MKNSTEYKDDEITLKFSDEATVLLMGDLSEIKSFFGLELTTSELAIRALNMNIEDDRKISLLENLHIAGANNLTQLESISKERFKLSKSRLEHCSQEPLNTVDHYDDKYILMNTPNENSCVVMGDKGSIGNFFIAQMNISKLIFSTLEIDKTEDERIKILDNYGLSGYVFACSKNLVTLKKYAQDSLRISEDRLAYILGI